jgi:hypothetical protein
MGYETRIYVVKQHSFPHEIKLGSERHIIDTGEVLAELDLCKAGYDGPIPELIERTKPKKPKFGLWAFNPEQQQEAVEFLRDLNEQLPTIRQTLTEKEAYRLWDEAGRPWGQSLEFWAQAEASIVLPSPNELNELSNNLEDGMVLTDKYGAYLGICTADEFMEALEAEFAQAKEEYRRFRWAYNLIKSIRESMEPYELDALRIITYGH